jgi:hypothetical protein
MRLSARLTLSLVAGVVLVSLGLALYQAQTERRGLRHELERRSLVLAEGLETSAAPLVQANSTRALQRVILNLQNHERLAGVAVYEKTFESLRWEQRWTSGGKGDGLSSNPPRHFMKGKYSRANVTVPHSTRFVQISSKWNLLNQLWNQRAGAKTPLPRPDCCDLK